ncbi:MAG: alpha/beta hydrolase [Myxococcota bacterium]
MNDESPPGGEVERLLDHPLISERYFFPRESVLASPTWIEVEGARLACAWGGPEDGPHPPPGAVLLHFHGNGEVVSDWLDDFGPALEKAGFTPFFAEYRGYGESTGRPMLDTMLDDALTVLDSLGVPPERVVVYGRSVGSLYAIHVAANRPVAGLVIESGIADLGQRLSLRLQPSDLGVGDEEFYETLDSRFDHRAKLATVKCRVLVLHTIHDHMVNVAHAHKLASWAKGSKLVEFAKGDHNSIMAHNVGPILEELARLRARLPF